MKIYKVNYWGGMDGRSLDSVYYTTKEGAENFMKNNGWGYGYNLEEIELEVAEDGRIKKIFKKSE